MKIFGRVFVFLLLPFTSALYSQNFWQPLNGPYGGIINTVTEDHKGNLYCGGWGTTRGVFKSTDKGNSWTDVFTYSNMAEVYTLAVSKKDYIFAGTNQYGFFRSTDNGSTWEQMKGYPGREGWNIIFDSKGVLYAGDGDWGGIFKSADDGVTWERLMLNAGPVSTAFDSRDILYAGCWNSFQKSTDYGKTWIKDSSFNNTTVSAILLENDSSIYLGTGQPYSSYPQKGVFHSLDRGKSWKRIAFKDTIVQTLAFTKEGYLLAGTTGSGVFISRDKGKSWQEANNGILEKNIFYIYKASDGNIYACSENNGGIFRSEDSGNSWTQCGVPAGNATSIAFGNDGQIFASTYAGIFSFDEQSKRWKNLGLGNVISAVVDDDNVIYAAVTSPNRVYRSYDKGLSWQMTGIPDTIWIKQIANRNNELFFSTSHGIMVSKDKCATYSFVNTAKETYWANSLAFTPSGDLYILRKNVYKSQDMGKTLSLSLQGLGIPGENGLAVYGNNDAYAADEDGKVGALYRTGDQGQTWQKILAKPTRAVCAADDGSIFCSSFEPDHSMSYSISKDKGESWTVINSGIPARIANGIWKDKKGYVYAAPSGSGIFRSAQPLTDLTSEKYFLPDKYLLKQNYPNPFNPATSISISIPVQAFVKLKVYDILGNEAAVLVNGEMPAGTHTISFDASALPSGAYIYVMQSGQFRDYRKMMLLK